jgi:hypothetical protein
VVSEHGDYSHAVHDLNIWYAQYVAPDADKSDRTRGVFVTPANYDERAGRGPGPGPKNGVVMSGLTSKLLVALVLAFASCATAGCTITCTEGAGVCGFS